ncbi:MAG: hypothetical protein ACHQJ6_08445, partial [Candidatus Berkiellales bacterium]
MKINQKQVKMFKDFIQIAGEVFKRAYGRNMQLILTGLSQNLKIIETAIDRNQEFNDDTFNYVLS